jgi:hypothetical protein
MEEGWGGMAQPEKEDPQQRSTDLQSAIEIAKAYATSSTKDPDKLAEAIEKTYRMIRRLRKGQD